MVERGGTGYFLRKGASPPTSQCEKLDTENLSADRKSADRNVQGAGKALESQQFSNLLTSMAVIIPDVRMEQLN